MTDIAIRVDNLSKLYPARSLRAGHLGAVHQRPDTTSAVLSASLRDALTGFLPRISRKGKENSPNSLNSRQASDSDDLWALSDVSFEVQRGEVVGLPARASGASVPSLSLRTGIGRNGAGKSTLLKILSRITEPTSGRAETCGGRVGSLLAEGDAAFQKKHWS